jgi:hypothetical protein
MFNFCINVKRDIAGVDIDIVRKTSGAVVWHATWIVGFRSNEPFACVGPIARCPIPVGKTIRSSTLAVADSANSDGKN